MSTWHPFSPQIDLYVKDHIDQRDAERQHCTAKEILRRLAVQPGVILADEVGMGKTFVALAVAASVALSDRRRRPVVVMVPPSLKEKWPRDFDLFREKCLRPEAQARVTCASAERAVDFLKLLDDPIERRKAMIFMSHGAMHRGLTDHWTKLAIIHRALYRRRHTSQLRRALYRCLPKLLQMSGWRLNEADWQDLLTHTPSDWLTRLRLLNTDLDDDPVPAAVMVALQDFDTTSVYEVLHQIPIRSSPRYDERVNAARQALNGAIQHLWRDCLTRLRVCPISGGRWVQ